MIEAPPIPTTRFGYLVVPLKEAKGVKKHEDVFAPEQLNELGEEGWEAVGLSLKYGASWLGRSCCSSDLWSELDGLQPRGSVYG